jgi:hypothetical protein
VASQGMRGNELCVLDVCSQKRRLHAVILWIFWFFRILAADTGGILKERTDPSDKTLSQTNVSL